MSPHVEKISIDSRSPYGASPEGGEVADDDDDDEADAGSDEDEVEAEEQGDDTDDAEHFASRPSLAPLLLQLGAVSRAEPRGVAATSQRSPQAGATSASGCGELDDIIVAPTLRKDVVKRADLREDVMSGRSGAWPAFPASLFRGAGDEAVRAAPDDIQADRVSRDACTAAQAVDSDAIDAGEEEEEGGGG